MCLRLTVRMKSQYWNEQKFLMFVCVCVFVYLCIWVTTRVSLSTCIFVCVCTFLWLYIITCMYISACSCAPVCMFVGVWWTGGWPAGFTPAVLHYHGGWQAPAPEIQFMFGQLPNLRSTNIEPEKVRKCLCSWPACNKSSCPPIHTGCFRKSDIIL